MGVDLQHGQLAQDIFISTEIFILAGSFLRCSAVAGHCDSFRGMGLTCAVNLWQKYIVRLLRVFRYPARRPLATTYLNESWGDTLTGYPEYLSGLDMSFSRTTYPKNRGL